MRSALDLKPGFFVKCEIMGQTFDTLFVLPRYLLKSGSKLFVFVNGKLDIRRVTVIRKFEDKVYISQGLYPGDQVISSPLPGAVNGMALTLAPDGEEK